MHLSLDLRATLDVGAGAHFLGTSNQYPDFAPAHFLKHRRLLHIGIVVIDIGQLSAGNSSCGQLVNNVLIDADSIPSAMNTQIAENHLCGLTIGVLFPNIIDLIDQEINLATGIIRSQGIDQTHVQCRLASFGTDFQGIILGRLYATITDTLITLLELML